MGNDVGLGLAETVGIVGNMVQQYGLLDPRYQRPLILAVLAPMSPMPVATCMLRPLPESFSEASRYLLNVQPTLQGGFVDKYGPAPGQLTLRGKFRMASTQVVNCLMPVSVDANAAARWLRAVCDLASGSDSRGRPYRVVLFNWVTRRHWQVAVKEFTLQQSTDRNTVWVYTLVLELLRTLPSAQREPEEKVPEWVVGSGLDALIENEFGTLLTGWLGQ